MEAISTLIRGDLPPVGRRILHFKSVCAQELPEFSGYYSSWVDSGTSALALAFLQARSLRPEIAVPEVILPGYCCPDLVAAAHYAGVTARIVDINLDDPSLNIDAVRSCISPNAIAIVAINFLGVAENLSELVAIKIDFPHLFIVEDNAQWFPQSSDTDELVGDFVTFSFGRGKPVSMLGGGLLLSKYSFETNFFQQHVVQAPPSTGISSAILHAKYCAYNQLLAPFFFQLLSRNPFISLGTTQYHSLETISALDLQREELLPANVADFQQTDISVEIQYDELFARVGFDNNFRAVSSFRRRRLLRYPVLFSTQEQKQRVLSCLMRLGLGATEMYKSELPEVQGVRGLSIEGELKNARSFASRFITLPVHAGVTEKHVLLMQDAFLF